MIKGVSTITQESHLPGVNKTRDHPRWDLYLLICYSSSVWELKIQWCTDKNLTHATERQNTIHKNKNSDISVFSLHSTQEALGKRISFRVHFIFGDVVWRERVMLVIDYWSRMRTLLSKFLFYSSPSTFPFGDAMVPLGLLWQNYTGTWNTYISSIIHHVLWTCVH